MEARLGPCVVPSPGMYNFKGEFVSRKKVDLRGSSRGEENREQVLQRTRREREKRKRQKLEQESATIIQACAVGCHRL